MLRKDVPDHHDADLVIKLYELRREPVMRAARTAIITKFLPRSFEDVAAVTTSRDHELNAAYRQVNTYWEMVYSFARHGVVEPEFLLESNGEGLILFARVEPYLEQIRTAGSPRAYRNAEWVATHTELGRQMMEVQRTRLAAAMGK